MIKILTGVIAFVLAGGTAYGVTHAVSDNTQRTSGETSTSTVAPYGSRDGDN